MSSRLAFLALVIGLVAGPAGSAENSDFPARKDYLDTQPINMEELVEKYVAGTVVLVDVRSKIEYDVIHPVDAVHIPISNVSFVADVGALAEKNPGKSLAFYCNGVTCLKSYEAARKAASAGHKYCRVYDGGIPEWATKQPEKTLLLGKLIENPQTQLISKDDFHRRCLEFEAFKSEASRPSAVVMDVRDNIQSSGSLPGLENALRIPLDRLIPNVVESKKHQDKTLLIFDQVGKQVEWLQYYLVEHGYKNYYFLSGGATAVLQKQTYRK
jgi:rhodanese-related sulfurtransferase